VCANSPQKLARVVAWALNSAVYRFLVTGFIVAIPLFRGPESSRTSPLLAHLPRSRLIYRRKDEHRSKSKKDQRKWFVPGSSWPGGSALQGELKMGGGCWRYFRGSEEQKPMQNESIIRQKLTRNVSGKGKSANGPETGHLRHHNESMAFRRNLFGCRNCGATSR
jgi:hypothetical protein